MFGEGVIMKECKNCKYKGEHHQTGKIFESPVGTLVIGVVQCPQCMRVNNIIFKINEE